LEQCVSLVDCWFSFIVYLCNQEYYPLLHSAGIPFTVSLSTQRLCQVPVYAGCLPVRHIRHAQERDKRATCVRPISNRPIWFRLRCSVEGWQLFTRYLIKNNRRVARNCFVDGLNCVSGSEGKLSLREVKGEIEVFILLNTNRN